MVDQRLRIGDAEREAAAHELGEHFAMGRITAEEHGERLERIWTARTEAELAPVFSDLPRPRRPEPPRPPITTRMRSWRPQLPYLPFLFRVLVGILVVAFVVSHLPFLLLAVLVYLLVVRRFAHRGRWGHHPHHPRWR